MLAASAAALVQLLLLCFAGGNAAHPPCLRQGVANVADVLKEQGGAQPVVLVSSCLVRCGACGGLTGPSAAVALLRGLHQPSAADTQRDRGELCRVPLRG